ncbi:MAG: polysaccharide deacetylase family protein [Clostridia bacterium]|nr:polysaccharide deacetylase family protein [Clostridia bacterium]
MEKKRNNRKPIKLLSMRTQIRILLGVGLGLALLIALLIYLSRQADYVSSLAVPVYDARTDVDAALARLGSGKAERLTQSDETDFKIKLVFSGVSNTEVMRQILDQLDKYDMKAVFCLSGIDAAESGTFIQDLLRRGHRLGSRGLRGETHLEDATQETLVSSFCQTNAITRDLANAIPVTLKTLNTQYTDAVLEAAYAAGLESAIDTPYNLDLLSFSSFSSVQRYVNTRSLGAFVNMNISEELEAPVIDEKPPEAKPAVDKQEDIPPDADHVDMSLLSANERILLISEWLIRANAEADYLQETVALREKNDGGLSPVLRSVRTTEKAASFLFSGVSSDGELHSLLNTLDEIDAKASFALTTEEIQSSAAQIPEILSRGHEIIPRVIPQSGADFYGICSRMLNDSRRLSEEYGAPQSRAIAILTRVSEAAREAASAAGFSLISYQNDIVRDEYADATDAPAVMQSLFGDALANFYLMRGQVVHFRRGVYADPGMLSRMVREVNTHSIYRIKTVNAVLSNEAELYTFPVPADKWLPGMDAVDTGRLPGAQAQMEAIAYHYIGTPSARYSDNLPGFTDNERGRLNTDGLVETDDRVVFLTFDDWGSDVSVTKLLDVLDKYNAEGTFFVATNYVENNANLLRAIAQEGHDIGSHTNSHFQLAIDPDGDMTYSPLSAETLPVLQEDVITSWYKLVSIVGDLENEGKPVLTKIFRPPTLAVSRDSMGAIFDIGMEYIVSGSYSTHDYEEDDPAQLYRDIRANLEPGAVLVLHMSDTAKNTAEALEMLFAYNETLSPSKRYTFARLSAYLDGTYTVTPRY